jgi:predicted RNA methylase
MNSVSSYFGRLAWGIRYVGFYNAALIFLAKLVQFFDRRVGNGEKFWHFAEGRLDKRLGVETVGMVSVEQLGVSEQQEVGAHHYEPTPFMEFGYVISRLPIDFSQFSFIDLGSGKGRTLLMAKKFLFRQILGVEFSPALHQTAQRNLEHDRRQRAGNQECRSICEDATTFEYPAGPLVIFMFSPFAADIMTNVISNIRDAYEQSRQHIKIVYCNPEHRQLLDESEFLTQTGAELNNYWLVYETK